MYVCMYVCMRERESVLHKEYIYVCVCTYESVCACMYVRVRVCVLLHIKDIHLCSLLLYRGKEKIYSEIKLIVY